MIDIKIKYLNKNITKPRYATDGSLGMDLSASLTYPVVVKAGERVVVPVGFSMQIPKGYGGFVFPRKGITMCNSVGVIDTDYTGEIKLAMINISDKDYTINPLDRVAQLVFMPVEFGNLIEVESLTETERGDGGFGSTGI
ncbi:MAG: dUTP diphosphatase [Oscillospiraceae bacterium]